MSETAGFIARHPVEWFLALSACLLALSALLWRLVQRLREPLWERGAALWQRFITGPQMQVLLPRHRWLRLRTPQAFAGGYLLLDLMAGFALVAAALSLFLEIADETGLDETLGRFDNALAEALRHTLDDSTLQAFALLTRLGDVETLTLLCIAVAAILLARGKRLLAASWIAAVAGNGLLNRLLKGIFERSRPLHDHGWTLETSWSFPSGHSSGALVTYGMLAYLLSRATPRIWHLPLTLLAITIALLVGYSRIVLQVHFFSDVLAGFISGATWLIVCIATAEVVRAQLGRSPAAGGKRLTPAPASRNLDAPTFSLAADRNPMTQNVLITGGNSGIGYEMALALAAGSARVIIAARDQAKSADAVARIQARHPAAQVEALPLDLADFAGIDRFAEDLLQRMPVLDVLILNAGLYTMKLHRLANGYEAMMGVMHFGHFRLVQRLLGAVKAAPAARIVVTSSMMHQLGRIDEASFTDPSRHRSGLHAYGQAKLANLLFTRELARRLAGTGITANAFHPGAVATDIYRQLPGPLARLATTFMLSPAQGADTAVWLATTPELAGVSGGYFVKRKLKPGSKLSRDPAVAASLWSLSEAVA